MKKKGFTLIELLGTVIILGLLLLIAVPTITKYIKRGTTEYYHSIENEIKTTGMDYLETYRTLLPRQIGNVTVLELEELVNNKYIDEVKDEDGNICTGKVSVKKVKTGEYRYYSCLDCGDNYKTKGEACNYSEDDNYYVDQDSYRVEVETESYMINQGDEFILPNGKAYYKDELVSSEVTPRPSIINTNKLGTTEVKYSYHGASVTVTVTVIDQVSPSVPEVVLKYDDAEGAIYTGNWYNGNIYQKFKSTDYTKTGILGSGIDKYLVSDDGTKFREITGDSEINEENGEFIKYVKSIDKSGNESAVGKYTIKIDKEIPSCSLMVTKGTTGNTDWYISNTTIDFKEKTETVSSIVTAEISETLITKEGTTTTVGTITDEAGNVGTCEKTINIDKTNPTVNYNVNGGTYSSNKTLTITASDSYYSYMDIQVYKNGSIINNDNNTTSKTKSYTLSHGNYTVYTKAYDLSGRKQSQNPEDSNGWYYQSYLIDTSEPTCSLKVTSGSEGSNGWYTSNVVVDWDKTDGTGSTIVASNIDKTNITVEGTTTVVGTVTDEAGNIGTCTLPVNIDKTAPTVSSSMASGSYTGAQNGTITASDSVSKIEKMQYEIYLNNVLKSSNNGLISDKIPIDLNASGTWKIKVKAQNKAGLWSNNNDWVEYTYQLQLCSYAINYAWNFNYVQGGRIERFTVPCDGTYKLEVWGAQGGTSNGGRGGYSTGQTTLTLNSSIYVVVGGQPIIPSIPSGYNGGGAGSSDSNAERGGGGGATHIGKTNTLLKNTSVSNLYIVAGGGGGGTITEGAFGTSAAGGYGGGTTGGAGGNSGAGVGNCQDCFIRFASGGTQTGGGIGGQGTDYLDNIYTGNNGSYGQGGNGNNWFTGGGGGYYGGGAGGVTGYYTSGGAGGSGYIGGVNSGTMQNGVRTGNGYARITLVSLPSLSASYPATVETSTYKATDTGHKHSGTEGLDYANGCYTKQTTQSVEVSRGYFYDDGVLPCGCSASRCNMCGGQGVYYNPTGCTIWAHGDGSAAPGWGHPHYEDRTVYELGCGKSETTNYTCPNGGTLSGSTCTVTTYTCIDGGTLNTSTLMCE